MRLVLLSKLGAAKGGKARAESHQQQSGTQIARKAQAHP